MRTTVITPESGTGFRCRSRHRRGLAALIVAGAMLTLAAACGPTATTPEGNDPRGSEAGGASDGGTAAPALDDSAQAACLDFWGDPTYSDPLGRTVLDRAGTARDGGADDPMFYAMTADDIESAFEQTSGEVAGAATTLAGWFRTEPEKGRDADLDAFAEEWRSLATACAPASEAATWAAGQGEDGTKPGALVCADLVDTPGTLTVYANANVLTSNMFKVVGLSPRTVGEDQMELVEGTDTLLAGEIAAVDDDGVRQALEEIRAPFAAALDGQRNSPGLHDALETLGGACSDVGYDIPPMTEDGQDDGGLV